MTTDATERIEPTIETVHAGDRFGPNAYDLDSGNYPDYFDVGAIDWTWLELADGRTALPHSVAFEDGNRTFSLRYLSGRKLNARVRHTFFRPLIPPVAITDSVEVQRTLVRRGREHVEYLATVRDEAGRVLMTSQSDWVMNSSVRHDQDSSHEQLPSVFDHPLPKRTFSIPVSPQTATLRVGDELPPLQRPAWLDVPPGGHGPDSVHGDEYARRVLGTRGAIVLGSTVLGYVNEQLGRALGPSWLERGSLDVRFISPVVRNDLVTARARVASIDADRVEFEVEVTNAAMDQQTSIVGTARYQF